MPAGRANPALRLDGRPLGKWVSNGVPKRPTRLVQAGEMMALWLHIVSGCRRSVGPVLADDHVSGLGVTCQYLQSIAGRPISPADLGGARISSCERSYNLANRPEGGGVPLRHRFASYWWHSHARHKLALRPGPFAAPSRTPSDRWSRPPSSGYRRPGPLPCALLLTFYRFLRAVESFWAGETCTAILRSTPYEAQSGERRIPAPPWPGR